MSLPPFINCVSVISMEMRMLSGDQLKAIDKLERLAAEELSKYELKLGCFHDEKIQMLSYVPGWAKHVRENHRNHHAKDGVEGCLENLRKVVRTFNFKLKE